jgi:hypothetical protein
MNLPLEHRKSEGRHPGPMAMNLEKNSIASRDRKDQVPRREILRQGILN